MTRCLDWLRRESLIQLSYWGPDQAQGLGCDPGYLRLPDEPPRVSGRPRPGVGGGGSGGVLPVPGWGFGASAIRSKLATFSAESFVVGAPGQRDRLMPWAHRSGANRVGSALGLITGRLRRRAESHFAGLTLLREDDANSFGVESAGVRQVRGNGSLALTKHELLFAQWVPNRLLRISRDSIVEVETVRSHLGKTIGRDLLKVAWATDLGTQDSIALWVGDLDGWLEALGS